MENTVKQQRLNHMKFFYLTNISNTLMQIVYTVMVLEYSILDLVYSILFFLTVILKFGKTLVYNAIEEWNALPDSIRSVSYIKQHKRAG